MADKPEEFGEYEIPDEHKIRHHSIKVFIDGGGRLFDLGFSDSFYGARAKAEGILRDGFWYHEEGKSRLFSPNRISEIEVVPLEKEQS